MLKIKVFYPSFGHIDESCIKYVGFVQNIWRFTTFRFSVSASWRGRASRPRPARPARSTGTAAAAATRCWRALPQRPTSRAHHRPGRQFNSLRIIWGYFLGNFWGNFLGSFCIFFDDGSIALEVVYTGILSIWLFLGQFLGDLLILLNCYPGLPRERRGHWGRRNHQLFNPSLPWRSGPPFLRLDRRRRSGMLDIQCCRDFHGRATITRSKQAA